MNKSMDFTHVDVRAISLTIAREIERKRDTMDGKAVVKYIENEMAKRGMPPVLFITISDFVMGYVFGE